MRPGSRQPGWYGAKHSYLLVVSKFGRRRVLRLKEKYKYQDLPNRGKSTIRIATVHPGGPNQTIRITLRIEQFDTEHCPSYEALSYAWGPPQKYMTRVILQHQKHGRLNKPMLHRGWLGVRSNLASALQQLRSESKPRDVWIDALCIDQDDEIQKGPQVAMMGEIFGHALRVIVWLGPESRDSSRAMGLIQSLGVQVEMDWSSFKLSASQYALHPDITDPFKYLSLEIDDLEALKNLFDREWFDRLWIRQEIFRANQKTSVLYCGKANVHWHIFRRGWLLIYMKPNHQGHHALDDRVQRTLHGFLFQREIAHLNSLRDNFKSGQCADPRDRIYAIRGLLSEELQQAICPDYTKSVEDVYKDAVFAYFRDTCDLGILAQCCFSPEWKGPSWAPDWSFSTPTEYDLTWKMASGMITSSAIMNGLGNCYGLGQAYPNRSGLARQLAYI
ncbi:heterokaryon incompatibility protein-domain-containing protein [Xylaria arbuscula]|nr:heterokaryon incompatibility protein-domain-containing protein [Xylaria arbuscula]